MFPKNTHLLALVPVLLLALLVPSAASADKVMKAFRGDIILAKNPFPTGFKGDDDMIKYLKRAKQTDFVKDKYGKWTMEYMAFFNKKPGSRQAVVVIFDLSGEKPEEIYNTGLTLEDSNTQIMASYLTISDDIFKPDTPYEMQIRTKRIGGATLAKTQFSLKDNTAAAGAEEEGASERERPIKESKGAPIVE